MKENWLRKSAKRIIDEKMFRKWIKCELIMICIKFDAFLFDFAQDVKFRFQIH